MVHLARDPKGETVLDPSSTTDRKLSSIPTKYVDKAEVTGHLDEVNSLKQRISQLEKKLEEVHKILLLNNGYKTSHNFIPSLG